MQTIGIGERRGEKKERHTHVLVGKREERTRYDRVCAEKMLLCGARPSLDTARRCCLLVRILAKLARFSLPSAEVLGDKA